MDPTGVPRGPALGAGAVSIGPGPSAAAGAAVYTGCGPSTSPGWWPAWVGAAVRAMVPPCRALCQPCPGCAGGKGAEVRGAEEQLKTALRTFG